MGIVNSQLQKVQKEFAHEKKRQRSLQARREVVREAAERPLISGGWMAGNKEISSTTGHQQQQQSSSLVQQNMTTRAPVVTSIIHPKVNSGRIRKRNTLQLASSGSGGSGSGFSGFVQAAAVSVDEFEMLKKQVNVLQEMNATLQDELKQVSHRIPALSSSLKPDFSEPEASYGEDSCNSIKEKVLEEDQAVVEVRSEDNDEMSEYHDSLSESINSQLQPPSSAVNVDADLVQNDNEMGVEDRQVAKRIRLEYTDITEGMVQEDAVEVKDVDGDSLFMSDLQGAEDEEDLEFEDENEREKEKDAIVLSESDMKAVADIKVTLEDAKLAAEGVEVAEEKNKIDAEEQKAAVQSIMNIKNSPLPLQKSQLLQQQQSISLHIEEVDYAEDDEELKQQQGVDMENQQRPHPKEFTFITKFHDDDDD